MEPLFALPVVLPASGSRDLLRTVHRQLRAAIVDGRLQPGLRLPSTRAFAAACGVSRNTAVASYDLLSSEGYLVTRRGAGTSVAGTPPQPPVRRRPVRSAAAGQRMNPFWRDATAEAPPAGPLRYDFRLGVPDLSRFDFTAWRRLSARALRTLACAPAAYAEPCGQPALRAAIAKHVSFARAVACRPEDVIVTAGAQQAFDLLARVLVTPGRTVVALENPGYPPLRTAFVAAGARIAPIPVDREGMSVDRLPADARVICVTPSHQFPLGVAMSMRRRAALLDFARARGAVVIEDDYDSEFRFGERPLDALQTLDRAESVFYVGTFSKSLFPALRLGFVVAPAWARASLVAAKRYSDWHCETLSQETLAAFIAEGHLARHVRKMRQVYAQRRDALLHGLDRHLSPWLGPLAATAGLHLTALVNSAVETEAIVQLARQQGVGIYSLRPYCFGKGAKRGFIFGYGAIDERRIGEGVSRLRAILEHRVARET